jgi:tRNA A-37 threonylcarbamoyl transferase component Bud32
MVRAMREVTGPGRVVAGRYELLDRLGQGAMGTVWRARDQVLHREVAVKEVRLPELMSDRDRAVLRERTLREARVSAKLSHPGVVTVYDVVEAGGTPWIVMELVAARSLDQVLAEDGPLSPRRAAKTGGMLLGALASAHSAGIVHRDVKPGNVLVTSGGRAVLTDFGIAAVEGDPALTQTGMVMGTPGFCAPERIRGEPATPASDLWSLGATLYAAVEGRGPFEGHGEPMAVLASIVHSDPPPAPSAGPLGAVIGALMSKDPARRPDAAAASRLLMDAATHCGGVTSTASRPPAVGLAAAGPAATFPDAAFPDAAPVFANAGRATASARTDPAGFPASAIPLLTTADPATASARTDPAGFPAMSFPPGSGPGGLLAGLPSAPLAEGVGTAQFPAGAGPDSLAPDADPDLFPPGASPHFCPPGARPGVVPPGAGQRPFAAGAGPGSFPPSTGPGAFPAGASQGPIPPAGAGPAPLPVSLGAAPFPATASREAGPAGQPGTRSSRGRRLAVLGLAGAGIVMAGLAVGLVLSRAMGPSAGSGAPTAAAPLPAGYRWYTPTAAASGTAPGFTMAVPTGWQARQQGATTYLRDPASGDIISVSPAPAAAGGPVREARMLERAALVRGSFTGYRRIAITPILVRGRLAGAWRFAYRQPGTGAMDGLVVVTQMTAADGRQPYELMATAPARQWLPARAAFAEAVRTFSRPG